MRNVFEKLWNEYMMEECSTIDTEEERELAKCAVESHTAASDLLTNEQKRL